MTKTQIQQLVVAVLLILFVGVFWLSNKTPESGGGPVVTFSPMTGRTPAETPEPPSAIVPAVPLDLSIPRDVFLPPALLIQRVQQADLARIQQQQQQQASQIKAVTAPPQINITDLELQGIFWGSLNPQAIINRKIVSVGDKVEDAEVEAITKESVTLSRNGEKFELKLEAFRSSVNVR